MEDDKLVGTTDGWHVKLIAGGMVTVSLEELDTGRLDTVREGAALRRGETFEWSPDMALKNVSRGVLVFFEGRRATERERQLGTCGPDGTWRPLPGSLGP
jgi:hypothetical protein